MSQYEFQQVRISGRLTTESVLHIGTGSDEKIVRDAPSAIDEPDRLANTMLIDKDGQPYIPASTLRGFLRDACKQAELNIDGLFGAARQTKGNQHSGNMGKVRVYDCCSRAETVTTGLHMRTAIDPVTATAKTHSLNAHHVVEFGTVFNVAIELDHCSRDEVETVVAALACFNRDGNRIGKGKSVGQGALSWQHAETTALHTADFKAWLQDGAADSKPIYQPLDGLDKIAALTESQWQSLSFSLRAESPLLINDPALVQAEEQRAEQERKSNESKVPCSDLMLSAQSKHGTKPCYQTLAAELHKWANRDDSGDGTQSQEEQTGQDSVQVDALIPASTLKGWLRGHCRRILLTIAGTPKASTQADAYLNRLFGGTDEGAGFLRFAEARVRISAADCHRQTFNAVDRFTGGVKDTALYDVVAVCPEEPFKGSLLYRSKKRDSNHNPLTMTNGMKLLLLFALRDAMEGDLVLGWGKAKGYGRLILQLDDFSDWQAFQAERLSCDTQTGFAELQDAVCIRETVEEAAA